MKNMNQEGVLPHLALSAQRFKRKATKKLREKTMIIFAAVMAVASSGGRFALTFMRYTEVSLRGSTKLMSHLHRSIGQYESLICSSPGEDYA